MWQDFNQYQFLKGLWYKNCGPETSGHVCCFDANLVSDDEK